jgi:hypothetical protein
LSVLEEGGHHEIGDAGSDGGPAGISPGGVYPVTEKDNRQVVLGVDPEGSTGKAKVTKALS